LSNGTSLMRPGLSGPARKLSLCSEADVAAADDCLEGWTCQVFDRSYRLLPSLNIENHSPGFPRGLAVDMQFKSAKKSSQEAS